MRSASFVYLGIILFPFGLFLAEFYLCKIKSKFARTLPIITACCFVLTGMHALTLAAIMFGIYFLTKDNIAKDNEQLELNKM